MKPNWGGNPPLLKTKQFKTNKPMTREKFNQLNKAAVSGTIKDNENPIFAFTPQISDAVLVAIAKGEINAQDLAKRILESRGLNIDGQWVGFNKVIK